MSARVQRLYPSPGHEQDLEGLYLALGLHRLGSPGAPFVYANFVSSLDGRIALADADSGRHQVPDHLTSPSDWRLFQELQAQADCLITHGGYLRAVAQGHLDDVLQVGVAPAAQDLAAWRQEQGIAGQPTVVVASASLDFPLPDSLARFGQKVYLATGAQADPARVRHWQRRGLEVIVAGPGATVTARPLLQALTQRGLCRPYLLAGPQMLETMLRDRLLDRLFLTVTHQILGGASFDTLVGGPPLGCRLRLRSLYYDPSSPGGAGQWFAAFDCRDRPQRPPAGASRDGR